ncbi:ATP-binding cassette domain-containing protein [Clostridium sp. CTA-7]
MEIFNCSLKVGENMIKVEGLTKEFKSNKKYPGFKGAIKSFFSREYVIKKAVDNISFEINDGEIVGYIGANGAGKSTTIKMMTGILTPTSGNISINGLIPYEDREKNAKNIGVVFGQRTQLWWDLPLSETFSLLKDIYEVNDNDYMERMGFLSEVLDINDFILSPVRTLSLGQRMRADLAAALLHNPKIIYLDEPTIGLDVVVKEKVRSAIKEINKKYETTIILTTHDLNDIEELCNRIIIIDNGIKIYDGSLKEIKDNYGYITTIEVQVKNLNGYNEFNINNELNISDDNLNMESQDNKIIIRFNRNVITQAEIISKIINKFNVLDFSIVETSIEDIIKKIYRKEV